MRRQASVRLAVDRARVRRERIEAERRAEISRLEGTQAAMEARLAVRV